MPNEQGMSKRQMIREKRAREQMRNRLISIVLIAVGVFFVFGLIIWPIIDGILHPYAPELADPRERPKISDNSMGDPNAPITITEYSDYQCPFCRIFWDETEEQIVQAFVTTGKVRFVYRSFGSFIGSESQASAEAAYCAGDQNRFWDMHDIIFQNQTGENVGAYTDKKLVAMAEAIGLDMEAFNACFDSGQFASRVLQDGKDGVAAGAEGTPYFVITYTVNGELKTRVLYGAEPFGTFEAEILGALAEMGLQ